MTKRDANGDIQDVLGTTERSYDDRHQSWTGLATWEHASVELPLLASRSCGANMQRVAPCQSQTVDTKDVCSASGTLLGHLKRKRQTLAEDAAVLFEWYGGRTICIAVPQVSWHGDAGRLRSRSTWHVAAYVMYGPMLERRRCVRLQTEGAVARASSQALHGWSMGSVWSWFP